MIVYYNRVCKRAHEFPSKHNACVAYNVTYSDQRLDHSPETIYCGKVKRLPRLTATMMVSDAALELSLDQLIGALDRKLFMECGRVQSAMPPKSRGLVATLTAEVRSQYPKESLEY